MCFACACLNDNCMSFSRVPCVREHRSMYALRRIAANSVVFIFLNKLLPFPDTLCFFFFPHVVIDEPTVSAARSMHSLVPVFVKQKANKMERVQVYFSVRKSYLELETLMLSQCFSIFLKHSKNTNYMHFLLLSHRILMFKYKYLQLTQ